eukprot:NODE_2_length_91304_cov_0.692462.p38 type:complete len:253 gc:universal NODE_2_length_91304_cov_0.692462:22677-23435(+)
MCFCLKSIKKKSAVSDNFELPDQFSKKYDIGSLLGSGGFGKVYNGALKLNQKEVVIKVLNKKDEDLPKEVLILQRLTSHPNIIKHVDHFYHNSWYIILEKFGYHWNDNCCDLFEMIEYYNQLRKERLQRNEVSNLCLTENSVKKIIKQLVQAVEFLRHNNVLHRDIKDENILVDQNMNIKLADFGSATLLGMSNKDRRQFTDEIELNRFGGVFSQFMGTIQYVIHYLFRRLPKLLSIVHIVDSFRKSGQLVF